jgi:hypothetical protein
MSEENEQPQTPPDPLTIGELITLPVAAELSDLSHNTLRGLAVKGKLEAKKIGRDWFTTLAAIEVYKKNRSEKNIPKKYKKPLDT